MSDYISKSEVLKLIHTAGGCDASSDYDRGWDECANHLYSEAESMPVAYDPDKVVEQLETMKNHKGFTGTLQEMFYNLGIDKAIEIVKGGEVE